MKRFFQIFCLIALTYQCDKILDKYNPIQKLPGMTTDDFKKLIGTTFACSYSGIMADTFFWYF